MATTIKEITYSGLNVGDTVTLFCRKSSESIANESSHTRVSESDPSYKTWYISVEYDVEYTYSIRLEKADGTISWPVSGEKFTEKSPIPSPSISISVGTTSVTANVDNLSLEDKVYFLVTTESGSFVNSKDGEIKEGSSISLTIENLQQGRKYKYSISINGTVVSSDSFTTLSDSTEQGHNISTGDNYITIEFYNYQDEDKLTVQLITGQSDSRYGSGSITIQGLESGTTYIGDIYLNDLTLIETFVVTTTGTPASTDPYIMNYGSNDDGTEIFVVVDRTKSTYTANVIINNENKGTYSCNDNSTIYRFSAEPNKVYIVKIIINNIELEATINTTLSTGEFQWTTKIQKWEKMESWQHPAGGHTHPAPVTAEEWNRLVKIVNTKCGTNIDDVSIGEPMRAGPGGNIRQVADALGVEVDKGYKITAKFFLDLQDAVNNIK